MQTRLKQTWTLLLLAHVSSCACSKWLHGNELLPTPVVLVNKGDVPVCGVYAWRPEDAGGTGMVATSPEMNNLLAPGTYMVAEGHDKALHPGEEVELPLRARAGDRYTVMARDCEENIISEEHNVCLRSLSPLWLVPRAPAEE